MSALARTRRSERVKAAKALGLYSGREWDFLVFYCGYRCVCCGAQYVYVHAGGEWFLPNEEEPWAWERGPTVDHIHPISLGGSSAIENVQPLCRSCNSKKYLARTDWRPEGWREAMRAALASGWRFSSLPYYPDEDIAP